MNLIRAANMISPHCESLVCITLALLSIKNVARDNHWRLLFRSSIYGVMVGWFDSKVKRLILVIQCKEILKTTSTGNRGRRLPTSATKHVFYRASLRISFNTAHKYVMKRAAAAPSMTR